jgi:hypothetical protein
MPGSNSAITNWENGAVIARPRREARRRAARDSGVENGAAPFSFTMLMRLCAINRASAEHAAWLTLRSSCIHQGRTANWRLIWPVVAITARARRAADHGGEYVAGGAVLQLSQGNFSPAFRVLLRWSRTSAAGRRHHERHDIVVRISGALRADLTGLGAREPACRGFGIPKISFATQL